jgi:hypothetical protein
MDYASIIIPAIVLFVGGTFLFKRVKYGSWTGAFLSGKIRRTVGEVTLHHTGMTSRTLTVNAMESANSADQFVGLVLASKAPMGASMMPFKLTRDQALDLSRLLQEAVR